MKVRRYLDYVFEQKKDIKIDEQDIFKILNEALREKVHMILRGRILKKIHFMEDLGLDFLSELTTYITIQSYISDDFIFMENDKAESMFYILQGQVAMIHKQTSTFIVDLKMESYFGEYGLISGQTRSLSAKCRDFTEVYVISKRHFE
jgi:signal-transduction protein with cAMP-binding, CBS, and nucleotidyltransferase domain